MIRSLSYSLLLGTALTFISLQPAQAQAPLPTLDASTQITPARTPYPDASLAPTQVKEAFATAAKTHRRVLLDFGGNWCPDCRILAGLFAIPSVNQWLEEHFVIVPVNVGHFDSNMEIARQYGVTVKAIPTVLILTPDGRLINKDGLLALGSARKMAPQSVVTILNEWSNRP